MSKQEHSKKKRVKGTVFKEGDVVIWHNRMRNGLRAIVTRHGSGPFRIRTVHTLGDGYAQLCAKHSQRVTLTTMDGATIIEFSLGDQPAQFSGYYFKKASAAS
ncbi:MAG TPA: hypothetical protein VN420_01830 [Candidatus Fimivivens sp.]|nr:hypothetical protein [Candidatus Fimivivens sp.]